MTWPFTKLENSSREWHNDEWSSLHFAAFFGRYDIVKILLAHGADVDRATSKAACSPLHLASTIYNEEEGHLVIEVLLDHGAACDTRDSWGYTPLAHAVSSDLDDYVEVLLSGSAQTCPYIATQLRDRAGHSLLHIAAGHNGWRTVRILLKHTSNEDRDRKLVIESYIGIAMAEAAEKK